MRGFGYSRWFDIPENNENNVIVFYDTLSKFERNDQEMEDHPMVVAINTEDKFQEIKHGVYITDKTIYLNPWNTEFIFFDEKDKRAALSLSDSSLETKLIRLYQRNFIVCYPDGSFPIVNQDAHDLNLEEIRLDKNINRLKGLLYGYYIGALLSVEQSKVTYYNILKELHNIFASILSNPSRTPSPEQENKLNALFSSLLYNNAIFKEIESEVHDRDKTVRIVNILERHGIQIANIYPSYVFSELKDGPIENNRAITWVSNQLALLNKGIEQNKKLLSPDDREIVVKNNCLCEVTNKVVLDVTERKLFVGLVNYILTDDRINGKISALKEMLADTMTFQAKELLGTDWENSPIRSFMNQLRRHVRGEEFSQKWGDGVLCSLAAVILKGDNWDTLLDFMKRKGMADYRLAYAFYGVINGFANLTRDFTDLLVNNGSSYVAAVYKSFHEQLHGKKIETASQLHVEEPVKQTPVNQPLSFKQRVWDFYKYSVRKGKRKQSKLDEELKRALDKIEDNEDGYVFVSVLNDFSLWGAKTNAWKEMQQEFCPNYESIRNSKKSDNSTITKKNSKNSVGRVIQEALGGIFAEYEDNISTESTGYVENNDTRSIIYDDNAIENIRKFLGTNINSDQILDFFVNFQESYRFGYYSKNSNQYRRNNYDVIDHFCKWCLSQKNKKALERTPANSKLMDDLKSYLLKIYHGRTNSYN